MSSWQIGIAGGGVGGIMTALLLAGDGHRVTLHERFDRLGGRLSFMEMGRYRIDQGPTIVLLPELLLDSLQEAGVDLSRISLLRCHPMCRIHYADGTTFDKWSELERQLAEIRTVFPGEEDSFSRYMRDHAEMFPQGKTAFLDRPLLKKSALFSRQYVQLLLQMRAYRSIRTQTARYFRDRRLVDAFSLQSLYIGGGPHLTPALYSFIPYAEHAFGVWYVKGGYAALVPLLEEALERRGVEVRLPSRITGIRVESGRTRGFETAEGFYPYDAVVYNGELPGLYELLPGRKRKPPAFAPSSGCLLLYLGAGRRWPNTHAHQFFLPDDLDRSMRQIFDEQALPGDPSYYIFNPAAIDPDAAPPGESVLYVMIPVPPALAPVWSTAASPFDANRPANGGTFCTELESLTSPVRELIGRVLADAERRAFPGLREAISEGQIRTPLDAQQTGLYQGGSFGIAPTFGQSGWLRPQIKPLPIRRLYAVGASVHPGGGVPIVMQGARLLAEHIRKETV